MLLERELITVEQALHLFIGKGFAICEIWDSICYSSRRMSTSFRKSMIATRQIDKLISEGIPEDKAQQMVIMQGDIPLTKRNLNLLGEPIVSDSVESLSNRPQLFDLKVCNIFIKGFFRRKLIIILEPHSL